MIRTFNADERPGGEWLDATDAYADAIGHGMIPAVATVVIDGEPSLVTVPFSATGRVGETAACPDRRVRARLAVALVVLARERVERELGGQGVVPG